MHRWAMVWVGLAACEQAGADNVVVRNCDEQVRGPKTIQLLDGDVVVDALTGDPDQITQLAKLATAELRGALGDSRVGGVATTRLDAEVYNERWFFLDEDTYQTWDTHGFVMHSPGCGNTCEDIELELVGDDWGADPADAVFVDQKLTYQAPVGQLDVDVPAATPLQAFDVLQVADGQPIKRGSLLRARKPGSVVDVWLLHAEYVFVGESEDAQDRVFVAPESSEPTSVKEWYQSRVAEDDTLAITESAPSTAPGCPDP